jgi:hypothetical protein
MKPGVVIVNTARGAVIDEVALVKALENGTVWSCGLDVYEAEPKIEPGLVANPHVILLPHMGTWTVEVSSSPTCSWVKIRLIRCRRKPRWRNGTLEMSAQYLRRASSTISSPSKQTCYEFNLHRLHGV